MMKTFLPKPVSYGHFQQTHNPAEKQAIRTGEGTSGGMPFDHYGNTAPTSEDFDNVYLKSGTATRL